MDAWRPGAHSRHRVQPGPQQTVLLLLPGFARPHRPREPESATHADGARAARRFFTDGGHPGPSRQHTGSSPDRELQRDHGRARLLPRQRHSGRPHRSRGPGAPQSAPAAECHGSDRDEPVQLCIPDRTGLAPQRSGPPHGLERRAEHPDVRTPSVGVREALGRRVAARFGRRLAADGDKVRDRHDQLRQHAAAHLQPDHVRGVHDWRELGASIHEPIRPGSARCERPPRGAARPPAVLSASEPPVPAAAGVVQRRSPGNDRLVRHRAAVPVLRLQHAVQRVGQRHETQGRAHHEGGPLLRAHHAPGGTVIELQRELQFQ